MFLALGGRKAVFCHQARPKDRTACQLRARAGHDPAISPLRPGVGR